MSLELVEKNVSTFDVNMRVVKKRAFPMCDVMSCEGVEKLYHFWEGRASDGKKAEKGH
jgi:hypothetical protein